MRRKRRRGIGPVGTIVLIWGIFCVHSSGPPAVRRADRRRSRHYGVRVGGQRAAPEGGKEEGRADGDPPVQYTEVTSEPEKPAAQEAPAAEPSP